MKWSKKKKCPKKLLLLILYCCCDIAGCCCGRDCSCIVAALLFFSLFLISEIALILNTNIFDTMFSSCVCALLWYWHDIQQLKIIVFACFLQWMSEKQQTSNNNDDGKITLRRTYLERWRKNASAYFPFRRDSEHTSLAFLWSQEHTNMNANAVITPNCGCFN